MNTFILETKSQIKKLHPKIQDVEVRVDRGADGTWISKIHVRAKRKILHAEKRDSSFMRSLDRCQDAIIHQIQKMKDKMTRVRHRRAI
ncbi:MAG: HPF/RaiA family ribosome-associated protein [Bacteriovoracia bacterium]